MANNSGMEKSKKFEDLLIVLIKHWKSIVLNILIITIISIAVSLVLEKKYTATASVLPPAKKGGLFGDIGSFGGALKDISKTLGRLGSTSDEAFSYLAILQSRTASERIIKKFNLRELYKFEEDTPYEDVIKELGRNVDFTIEDEGNIEISVTDKSPIRAAKMTNFYIQILNEISTELATGEAKSNREFIEKRFFQLQNDIITIEDSLKIFSQKYNLLALDEQVKAGISVAAELKAQIELAKMEREILMTNFGLDHPIITQANLKVSEMEERLSVLKYGEERELKSAVDFLIPFKNIPEIGLQYLRLMRDFEIQTKILEFLYPIYEQAKIEEQKNIPVVLVLDKAIPPERKSSPKRMIIVLVAFLLSTFFSIGFVLLKESYSSLQENEERYLKIKKGIVDPLKNIFRFRKS